MTDQPGSPPPSFKRRWLLMTLAAIVLGAAVRLAVLAWSEPWTTHHPDEHLLPLDAIALWEGVTPREVGWPASPTRLVLSAGAGVELVLERGGEVWALRHDPERAVAVVADWIARRYADPAPLYRLGRMTSVAIGILQLLAVTWALAQWVGPRGTALGTLASALGPVPILYSQYVLADMTGVLFATIVLGLAARPTPRHLVFMGLFGGLAATSKFHFGLWLLTPLLSALLHRELSLRARLSTGIGTLAVGTAVILALVPWFWMDPFLTIKEVGGVVGSKVAGGPSPSYIAHATILFGGLGILAWLGGTCGVLTRRRDEWRRVLPVLVPTLLGAAVLVTRAVVFDRYGLVCAPGIVLLAAFGWERLLEIPGKTRRVAQTGLALCVSLTSLAVVESQRIAGETDVDVLARDWVLQHVPRGRRVAVYDEVTAYLPRSVAVLRQCLAEVESPDGYSAKWRILGFNSTRADSQPMRTMLLTDEIYRAYWCQRELDVRESSPDAGYDIVQYHGSPRFGTVLERDVFSAFRAGGLARLIDVLIVNRPVDVGVPPAVRLQTRRGERVIYVR